MLCLLSMGKEYSFKSQSKPNYSLARSLLTQVMALLPRPAVRLFADEVVKEQDRHNKKAGVSESAKGHSYPANLIHQLEIQAI